MGYYMQFFGTFVVCYLSLIIALTFTWPSSCIELFANENTTSLNRAMTDTEVSLLGSLSSVGALLTTPIFGYLLDVIGRRYSMIVAGIPYVICWAMIAITDSVEVILTAMFLSGVGGAAFLVTPVYVSEICQDSIRGSMTSMTMIFMGLGSLFSYLCGGYLSYEVNIYIQLLLTVFYMVLVYFIKESPLFLLQTGKEREAIESLSFYRNVKTNSVEVKEEIDKLKRILSAADDFCINNESDDLPDEMEKLSIDTKSPEKPKISPWKFLLKSKSSRYGIYLILAFVTSTIFMGMVVVQVYAVPLFNSVVPSMSSTLCSIILAAVGIPSTIISAYLIEAAGRKALMIGSSISSGLFTLLLGTQLHLKWGPDILTPIFIYAFCISFYLGAGSVPYVLVAELFLPEVKGICSMLTIEWAWLMNFLLLLIYNPLVTWMGLGQLFYAFSCICILTAIISYFYQPETKGLSVDVIQMKMVKI